MSNTRSRKPLPRTRKQSSVKRKPPRKKTHIDPFEVDLNEDTRRLGARYSFIVPKGMSLNDSWVRHGAVSIKPTNTYIYLGHGGENTFLNDQIVPDNCTLSTIAESGLPGNLESTLLLSSLSTTHHDMITNPVKNYSKLFHLFKDSEQKTGIHHQYLKEGEFHVKLPKEHYKNKRSDFLFKYSKGKQIILFRSGLYNIATPGLNLPRLEGDDLYDQASITMPSNGRLTISNIRELYRGCVYPYIDDILENISKNSLAKGIDITDDTATLTYMTLLSSVNAVVKNMDVAQLMERFPGNHYFFVCRTQKQFFKHPYTNVLEQRKLSTNRAEAMLGHPIVKPSNYGWSLRAEQHFMRELQKVFVESYPESDKDEVVIDENTYQEVLIYKFGDFIQFKGKVDQKIIEFLNKIIIKIKEILIRDPSGYVHINQQLRELIKQSQQYDNIERIDLP